MGFIHAGQSARCAVKPLGLSFPTCQLEMLTYFSAVPQRPGSGRAGNKTDAATPLLRLFPLPLA